MKKSGYFWTKFTHFLSELFFGTVRRTYTHSYKKHCLKPSNTTLKGLIELKHRQIYKTQKLSH